MLGLGLPLTNIASILSGEIDLMSDLYCKAWVVFDGYAATLAAADSYNVSSITDNGTGSYAINFTTDMPSANYTPAVWAGCDVARNAAQLRLGSKFAATADPTASIFSFDVGNQFGSRADADYVAVAIFGG